MIPSVDFSCLEILSRLLMIIVFCLSLLQFPIERLFHGETPQDDPVLLPMEHGGSGEGARISSQ